MKRLDIRITDRLDAALETLKIDTERSKTEVVHDAVAILDWARVVYGRGNVIGEINPDSGVVVTVFAMPMFVGEVPSRPDEQSQNREPAVEHDKWVTLFRAACAEKELSAELADELLTTIGQPMGWVKVPVEKEDFDLVDGPKVLKVVSTHSDLHVSSVVKKRRKAKDKVT